MSYYNIPPGSAPVPPPPYGQHAPVPPEARDYWDNIVHGMHGYAEANEMSEQQRRALEQGTLDAANRIRWTQQMR